MVCNITHGEVTNTVSLRKVKKNKRKRKRSVNPCVSPGLRTVDTLCSHAKTTANIWIYGSSILLAVSVQLLKPLNTLCRVKRIPQKYSCSFSTQRRCSLSKSKWRHLIVRLCLSGSVVSVKTPLRGAIT